MTTVIDHVLGRLRDIRAKDIFRVPGDYTFPVNDAISNHRDIRWIGCSKEPNAAHLADGYLRIRNVGAVCATHGVGERSAMDGFAGAYAEHLPIVHLGGTPSLGAQTGLKACITLSVTMNTFFGRMTEPGVALSASR